MELTGPEDPFDRLSLSVLGRRIRYVDEGRGQPIIFLSGNGAYSYQWRNVVRFLSKRYRCVVPDLPGLGHSQNPTEEPGGGHSLEELSAYLGAFLELIEPSDPVVVGHELGAALGAQWAMHHDRSVAGYVSIEGITEPADLTRWPVASSALFERLRSADGIGLCVGQNAVIEQWLPLNVGRDLKAVEMEAYRRPYPTMKSRSGLLRLLGEFPTIDRPGPWSSRLEAISSWLGRSAVPKLQVAAEDGLADPGDWSETDTYEIAGGHFVLEDSPAVIVQLLADWVGRTGE